MDQGPATSSPPERVNAEPRSRTVTWEDPIVAARAGAAMSGIDYLRALAEHRLPAPPIAALMGLELDEISAGRVVFTVIPGEHHYNPIGVAHGGLAATLLDSAMGCAVHSLLPHGRFYTTLEIKINFVRALKRETGRVRAVAQVVHLGQMTATAEGRILDEGGQIYAHGSTTCMLGG
jgi:uncharacterized protein (TIGR00369 family)